MSPEEVKKLLAAAGAIREGHFELSSGRHSTTYVQCALVLQQPADAERLGRALAERFAGVKIDCVVSPALGGVILGHEVARALGVRAVFVERDGSGHLALRRGFDVQPGEAVLVVEDVWTTGGSTAETIQVVQQSGGRVVAAAALIDRSPSDPAAAVAGRPRREPRPVALRGTGIRAEALLDLAIPSFEPGECPLCRAGSRAEKPGSRFARSVV
jgi:orotate phosphoribosyltransferase